MAGAPAIVPRMKKSLIVGLAFKSGAAIPIPSVILCRVKPMIKKVPNAASLRAKEEPMANPSPKL